MPMATRGDCELFPDGMICELLEFDEPPIDTKHYAMFPNFFTGSDRNDGRYHGR